jgi:hypothetical protein
MNIQKHETHTSKKREMFHEVLKAWTHSFDKNNTCWTFLYVGPNKNYTVL